MEYLKDTEKKKLFEIYQKDKYSENIFPAITFMVDNIDSLFNDCKGPLFKNIGSIFEMLMDGNHERINDFISEIENKGTILNLTQKASMMNSIIKNLQNLLSGNIESLSPNITIPKGNKTEFSKTIKLIAKDHIKNLNIQLKKEAEHVAELLYQKSLEDAQALIEGQQIPIGQSKTYKLLKNIHDTTLDK